MSIKNNIYILLCVATGLTVTSCRKYLDVNKNPNVAQNVTLATLLPSGEVYISSALGVDLNVNGSIWAQYWTQNPSSAQYRNLEQYQPTASTYEYPWQNLYQGAENLYQLDSIANAQNKKQYHAVSLLLRAYTFQLITDGWGDVPFTQALKAQPKDGGIVNPAYDAQKIVYTGILSYIDQALAIIDNNDAEKPGADDLIYGGDMTKWKKFAYTLKLKALLRISYIDPGTASAGIAALPPTGGDNYIGEGDGAQVNFSSTAGNKNPFYADVTGVGGTQNVIASATCLNPMNNENDYRLYLFYEPSSTGAFIGIQQGAYDTVISAFSIPTAIVGADASDPNSALAPVKFLTSYESFFLQAEATLRFSLSGSTASALYTQGIHASFFDYSTAFNNAAIQLAEPGDVSVNGDTVQDNIFLTSDYAYYSYINGDTLYGAGPSDYANYDTATNKLRLIIIQKWFSMCGNQGFEAWTEWRRTGYPDFFTLSAHQLTGGKFPQRFVYPNSEITRNLNFPGTQPVTAKVWWDNR